MRVVFIVALLAAVVASATDEVLFTQLVHRHGSRSPIVSGNQSIICEGDGGFGCGELNLEGRDMLTKLGELIRARYPTKYTDTSYNWATVFSRSTAKNRTIQSSDSMLRGLFPNASEFYPIIYNKELVDDMLLLSDNYAALNFRIPFEELYNTPTVTAKRLELFPDAVKDTIFKELHIEGIAAGGGDNYGLLVAQDIAACYMATGRILDGRYPVTKASQTKLDQLLFTFNSYRFIYNRSEEHWVKSGSSGFNLATKMVGNMESVIDGSEQHFMIEYSAHDTTLAPLCATLGAVDEMTPVFGKMYLFELVNRSGAYYVRAIGGQPQQDPSDHKYTTYNLPLSGIPVNGSYGNTYVVANDTGVLLGDFNRFVMSSQPTTPEGLCYIGEEAFARIGCDVLGVPNADSSCYKYRYECPDFGCPAESYMSNQKTLACTVLPTLPTPTPSGFNAGESAGLGVACTALGVAMGAMLMFIAGRIGKSKGDYEVIQ